MHPVICHPIGDNSSDKKYRWVNRSHHAGGMAAFSRWLRRGLASRHHRIMVCVTMHPERMPAHYMPPAGIPPGCIFLNLFSGGVASLNHRLQARKPPACQALARSTRRPAFCRPVWDVIGRHAYGMEIRSPGEFLNDIRAAGLI